MAKRKDIIKAIRAHAKTHDLELTIAEGGNHTKIVLGDKRSVVARHAEINDHTARAIYKQLGMKP